MKKLKAKDQRLRALRSDIKIDKKDCTQCKKIIPFKKNLKNAAAEGALSKPG